MRRVLFTVMSTLVVVVALFGYRTSTPSGSVATPTAVAASGDSGSTSGTTTAPAPTTTPSTTPSPSASGTRTVAGQVAQTRWGPVQVQITVSGSTVTGVTLLQVPSSNGRDVQINNAAVPVLKKETLAAQSADIDSVSGATVTSNGYVTSLQSALDAAGL